jgi:hypothetical protein
MTKTNRYMQICLLLELAVLALAYTEAGSNTLLFYKAAARLSGRLSLIVFAAAFLYDSYRKTKQQVPDSKLLALLSTFAIVHIIHWFLLATAIYLGGVQLPALRLLGGVLAYIMIVALPIFTKKYKITPKIWSWISNLYFHYVWLIFALTYLARLTGKTSFASGSMPSYTVFASITMLLLLVSLYFRFFQKKAND